MNLIYKLAKYKTVLTLAVILGLGLVLSPSLVSAECVSSTDPFCINDIDDNTALGTENFQVTVTKIINIALSLLGIVSVVIILIGGFRWMTAGGNDDKVAEARKWIFSGVIGLAIILSAWAIARFVLVQLGQATGVAGSGSYEL